MADISGTVFRSMPRGRTYRLPDSRLTRHAYGFHHLIHHVRPEVRSGADLIGELHRCGRALTAAQLRPDETWPACPILLENAGHTPRGPLRYTAAGSPITGGWVPSTNYIVWQMEDWEEGEWIEKARFRGFGLDWAAHLGPILYDLVQNAGGERPSEDEQMARAAAALVLQIDSNLAELPRQARPTFLSIVHERVKWKLAESLDPTNS